MKRASLSALPPRPQPEPADLTDRLLAREGLPAPEPTPAPAAAAEPSARPARPRRARPAKPAAAQAAPAPNPTEGDLRAALRQAQAAAEALRQAGRAAPARYEVALRYRLEALAHHVQQVTEFITARVGPER